MSITRSVGPALLVVALLVSPFQPAAAARQQTDGDAGRAAPLVLTPHKLDTLKLGMSAEQAVETGYLVDNPDEPCGQPAEVISTYASRLFIGWNSEDDTIDNIFIKGRSVARTKPGVGVRSTVADMREGHPGLRAPREVAGDGGRLWMQALRRGQDWLIFGLSTPASRQPRDSDRVRFIFIDRDWSPRDGLHGGC